MRPDAGLFGAYLVKKFGARPGSVKVVPLGRGSHGQGFRASFTASGHAMNVVVKRLEGGIGLGHDYPSDRAGVFLLAMESFSRLPGHVKALDVLALDPDGGMFSVAGGSEYYLVMEEARGTDYFADLKRMAGDPKLRTADRRRVSALAKYLAKVHATKKDAPELYYRKLRDTVGHGECLMGVFDTYDTKGAASFTSLAEMADIEKAATGWRTRLKPHAGRLCRIHGDFHPGNILFAGPVRFTLLDRSRGQYGEAADDVTALAINYVFFSLIAHGRMAGAYDDAIRAFFGEYAETTGDSGIFWMTAPFFAFRGSVVANPLFYPDVEASVRQKIFGFVHGALRADTFDPARVDEYIRAGMRYRRKFRDGKLQLA